MVWILMWSWRQAIALAVIVGCLVFWTTDPLLAQTGRQLSDESLDLGKKWMVLARAAAGARLAADDMRIALQRMEADHSDAAWNILEAKKGIALSAISNLGDLACAGLSPVWEKVCSLGKETANTWNAAWHCGEGSSEHCAGMTTSYLKVAAQMYTKNGHRVVDGYTALDGVRRREFGLDQLVAACDAVDFSSCPVVALVKNAREAQEVRALKGQLDTIFANNLRIGNAALQRAEQRVREIERQASEAYAAYRTQREKDEAIKAEKDKREQEEIAQAKKDNNDKERVKRQQAETEQARNSASMPSPESVAQRQGSGGSNGQNERGGAENSIKPSPDGSSQSPVSGGKSFDVTAWNYGDPVPGVEHPPEFDKPKKKTPCRLKDTSCLDPLYGGDDTQSQPGGPSAQNPWSQEIEQKIKGGLLSSEQIRQDIEQKVRGGLSSQKKPQGQCDEHLGCPDDESGSKGPGKDLLAKLDSDLDRIGNSQAGTAGGALPGESLDAGDGGSSSDQLAMLRSLRSGLGAYRQGRDALSSSGISSGSSGGNCPNMVPYPPELIPIAQRRGTPLPPMPTVDEMIRQAGGAESAASALREQINAQKQALVQWPRGREEEVRRLTELTLMHNQQILQAVECRRSTKPIRTSPPPSAPMRSAPPPQTGKPATPMPPCQYCCQNQCAK